MTREEAIRILDPETTGEALAEIEHYNGFSGKAAAVQAVTDACILAVSALREQEERRWIPVTERLPSESGRYVVFVEECVFVFHYSSRHKMFNAFDDIDRELAEIHAIMPTHWMPLPEPPKEE